MKQLIATLFLLFALQISAAEYSLPTNRQPAAGTWAAAGVPGGIPNRTTISTTINSTGDNTDRTATINAALAACPVGQVVKLGAGTFVCNGAIFLPQNKPSITLRGTVDSKGNPATLIDRRVNGGDGISMGTGYAFSWPPSGTAVTVAGLTKGATSLQVVDSSFFANGQLVFLQLENEITTPVFSVYGYRRVRGQVCKIKDSGGIPDATHVVIDAPGLHGDYAGVSGAILQTSQNKTYGQGVEDIAITNENMTGGPVMNFAVNMSSAYGSWCKNVRVKETSAYSFYLINSMNCEIRRGWLEPNDAAGSTSSGGILTEYCSSILSIDNVFDHQNYVFIQQHANSGNVWAYNCFVPGAMELNHDPWNQYTLLEGNVGMAFQSDGYYGGSGPDTMFRNWFMGSQLSSGTAGWTNNMNRFARNYSLVGNVIGRTGIGGGDYNTGYPNLGNGYNTGTAEPSKGDWWSEFDGAGTGTTALIGELTSRTDDTHGVVTLTTGRFDPATRASSGYPSLVLFSESLFAGSVQFVHYTSVTNGGATITIEKGPVAITLPPLHSTFEIWGSPSGYQEIDLDVANTLLKVSNYLGKTSGSGIPEGEVLPAGDTLPDSLFLSEAPEFWMDAELPWPPIDPTDPNETTYAQIPAGQRFIDAPPTPTPTPTATPTATRSATNRISAVFRRLRSLFR